MALFAGLGTVELAHARGRPALVAVASPVVAWAAGLPWLAMALPSVPPWDLHLAHTALVCFAFGVAGVVAGRALGTPAAGSSRRQAALASGVALGALLAGVYGVQALYEGDWHQWSAALWPGDAVRQTIALPGGWRPPPGGRAELRFYVAGRREPTYEPVVSVNGHELAHLGPAMDETGPLRFWEKIMVAARNQGKARPEVPQWVAVPLDLRELTGSALDVELEARSSGMGAQQSVLWVWGDYAPRPAMRLYEGPPAYSRIQGQDEAFLKFIATGEYGIWRWQYLQSAGADAACRCFQHAALTTPERRSAERWRGDDLSAAPGRQTGEYRIRVVVYAPNGDLAALF
jgi:hypothetical protein